MKRIFFDRRLALLSLFGMAAQKALESVDL